MIVGVLCSKKECRQGKEVFREEIFHVVKYVGRVVYSLLFIHGIRGMRMGGGGI